MVTTGTIYTKITNTQHNSHENKMWSWDGGLDKDIKKNSFISKLQKPAEHCAEYSVTNNLHL